MKKPPMTRLAHWVENDFMDDEKWWDKDAASWRVWLYNNVGGAADWLNEHTPHRHYIEDDHCMRPEHRYCIWCNRQQSNAELGQQTWVAWRTFR